ERQRQEAERKRVEEEKRRQDELRRQQEAERQRQIEEERKELERLKRLREAEERRRREAMAQAMAEEEAARAAAERRAAQVPWTAAIVEKIRRNWQRPPGSADRFNCQVRLEQLPGGEVIKAEILRSCGTAALDRSVENAVLRASPLPSPPRPDLFERVIVVTFCPTVDAC
ncbi:MAG: energy transducer TonB, partial [Pseudomonadota bacterium]